MQFSLFAKQDQLSKDYQELIKVIKNKGKLSKFLDCRIRKLGLITEKDVEPILKAIRDIETIAVGLCIAISEIASSKPLKTSDLENIFTSIILTKDLKLESDSTKCWDSFFDLKSGVNDIGRLIGKLKGNTINPDIIMKEYDISERYVDLTFAVTRLGLIMRNEVRYDI